MEKFINRFDAGKRLAKELTEYKEHPHTLILALPRGGVPVAYVIATELSLPLDVFLVRKIGVPDHSELAMGSIASEGMVYLNDAIIRDLQIPQDAVDNAIASEMVELKRRVIAYRGDKPYPDLKDKTIILVDDGIATGATIRVAIEGIRKKKPTRIILAVPVAPPSTLDEIAPDVERIICPLKPVNFSAVGLWYDIFGQTSDDEVCDLLAKANNPED